jgi:hypothetical protein
VERRASGLYDFNCFLNKRIKYAGGGGGHKKCYFCLFRQASSKRISFGRKSRGGRRRHRAFLPIFFCQDAPPKFSLACVTWSQLPPNVGRPRQQRAVSQRYILRKIYMCAHALLILSLSFLNTRTRRALVLLFLLFRTCR